MILWNIDKFLRHDSNTVVMFKKNSPHLLESHTDIFVVGMIYQGFAFK